MEGWTAHNVNLLEGTEPLDASLVELVLLASECSEDQGEIFDSVDRLFEAGRVRLQRI